MNPLNYLPKVNIKKPEKTIFSMPKINLPKVSFKRKKKSRLSELEKLKRDLLKEKNQRVLDGLIKLQEEIEKELVEECSAALNKKVKENEVNDTPENKDVEIVEVVEATEASDDVIEIKMEDVEFVDQSTFENGVPFNR